MAAHNDTKSRSDGISKLRPGRIHAEYEQTDLEGCKLVGSGGAHDFGMHGPGDAQVLLIG
jgi:hypothetical protein